MFEYSLNILSKIKNSKNINSSNFNNSILTRTFEILKYCKQFDFKKIKYLNIFNLALFDKKKKNFDMAIKNLEKIIKESNEQDINLKALITLSSIYIERDELKKAKEAIKTAMDLDIKTNFRYTNLNIYKEDTKLNINDKFENISFFKLIIHMKFFREKNLNILKNIFDFIINFYKKNKKNNLMKLSSLIQKLIFQNKNVLLKSILKEKFSEIIIHLINLFICRITISLTYT
ncbi:hypothetical protein WG909_07465 [Peptostreptococcaceae bacterium AGR-M142]